MTTTQPTTHTTETTTLPPTLQRIVLCGFMGSGKSSTGRILAQHLGWSFLDLDDHIEARTGSTIRDLFTTHGEPHFRHLESTALANALGRAHTVLALGGGAPEHLTNRLLLEQKPHTLLVYLEAPFPVLFDRCTLQSVALGQPNLRPVLADPTEALTRFHLRQPHYRRLARLTIDTAALTPTQTAEQLLQTLTIQTP